MMSRALRAHSPGSISALLPLLKSKFPPGKLRNGHLFGRSRQDVTFPLRLGDVLGTRLSQRTCLGFRGADRAATTNRLSPTHGVPRGLPRFETRERPE